MRFDLIHQAADFFFHHAIALAGANFQAAPVEHRNMPAPVADETLLLQSTGGFRDAFATHAEHVGHEFLRHDQFAGGNSVECHQQPAAQLLFNRVVPIAYRSLRHLSEQRLRIAQQEMKQRAGAVEFLFQHAAFQSVGVAGLQMLLSTTLRESLIQIGASALKA